MAATGETAPVDEKIVWTHCHVNCGGACVLQCHVADDEIVSVESDNTGDASFGGFQARACLRGPFHPSLDQRRGSSELPLAKRVEGSKRGEGKYEQISWDEALDTIASELKRITEAYGNESVFIQGCSGVEQNVMMNNPWFRLFNLCGGVVTRYGNYSNGALTFGAQLYTYGGGWGNRSFKTLADGELVVMFGNAPATLAWPATATATTCWWPWSRRTCASSPSTRAAARSPRTATWSGFPFAPAPTRRSWPASPTSSSRAIWSTSTSCTPIALATTRSPCRKAPRPTAPTTPTSWAPATTWWRRLRRGLPPSPRFPSSASSTLPMRSARPSPCFICQGWGPQRRTNGETAARAIALLPQLVGQVGLPSTNSGLREGNGGFSLNSLPTGDNPITAKFPNYLGPRPSRTAQLTALNAGIQGADALPAPIKMMINYGNNMPANQNGDINFTTDILRDDSLCEFIVCYDVVMTDSAKYADVILPDLTPQETWTLSTQGENNDTQGIWFGQPTASAKFERREVCTRCAPIWPTAWV